MRVIHLTSRVNGGAGRAAYLLHSDLTSNGIKSKIICGDSIDSIDSIDSRGFIKLNIVTRISLKICAFYSKACRKLSSLFLNSKPAFLGLFTPRNIVLEKVLSKTLENTDVVVIHWVSEFISFDSLNNVFKNLPNITRPKVIFSNFDMAHYTGGCHFSFGCEGYKFGCDNCPYTNSFFIQRLISNHNLAKAIFISENRAHAVSFSEYTTRQSVCSSMPFTRISKYSLPIDRLSRDSSNANRHINVFLGAYNKDDFRKGYNRSILVFINLKNLDEKLFSKLNIHVPRGQKGNLIDIGLNVTEYDYMASEKDIMDYLGECDVYFNATYDEQGPTMLLMAALSNTSYFSSDVGLSNELREEGFSGCIVDDWNIDKITKEFKEYLENLPKQRENIVLPNRSHIPFSNLIMSICDKEKTND